MGSEMCIRDSHHPEAHHLRGWILSSIGQRIEAADALVSAGKLQPSSKGVQENLLDVTEWRVPVRVIATLSYFALAAVWVYPAVVLLPEPVVGMTFWFGLFAWIYYFSRYLRSRKARRLSPRARAAYEAARGQKSWLGGPL